MATNSEVTAALALLVNAFPRDAIEPRTVKVYCEMLADIPPAELYAACVKLAQSVKYFPAISVIREAWALAKTGPKRTGMDAWGDVIAEVRRVGWNGTPVFTDPAIPRAIRTLGGWQQLCASENTMADRKHFAEAYESIAARNLEAVQLGKAGMRPELPPARPSVVRELPEPAAEPADIQGAVASILDELTGTP